MGRARWCPGWMGGVVNAGLLVSKASATLRNPDQLWLCLLLLSIPAGLRGAARKASVATYNHQKLHFLLFPNNRPPKRYWRQLIEMLGGASVGEMSLPTELATLKVNSAH